ncbi:SWI/SNF-related matrix-associated actin-dependent regulator of chromatin subfamily A-like protein 1 [Liolophura sinensis]|uniref:SWI/SNF-related matrix-associated actin-dependent regulator of chromatin subfamily A-like protein 1 n=1 Tax=Liolophura sinensis TaxID=3198878 RepID=UPI0031599053
MSGLTEQQKLRIEENKKKALARLAERRGNMGMQATSAVQVQRHLQGQDRGKGDNCGGSRQMSAGSGLWLNKASVGKDCSQSRVDTTPLAQAGSNMTSKLSSCTKTSEKNQGLGNGSEKTVPEKTSGSSVSLSCAGTSGNVVRPAPAVAKSATFYGTVSKTGQNAQNRSSLTATVPKPGNFGVTKSYASTGASHVNSRHSAMNTLAYVTGKPNLFNSIKGKCVLCSREHFKVEVGFHTAMVEVFKTMKTRQYDVATRLWSFKLEEHDALMQQLRGLRPDVHIEPLPTAVRTIFKAQFAGKYPSNQIPEADLAVVDPVLQHSLMPFQRTGVSFGVWKKGRVLIADDMGLGKTIQAICLASYYRHEWPLLVVVPSSVRFDWAEQLRRWVPSLDPQSIVVITTTKDVFSSARVVVISYDLMARKAQELKQKHFEVIIMDESHLLKNIKTARTKAAMPLLQAARRVILLTGTPALSRPSELYTQIVAVCPGLMKFHEFGVRYCDGKELPWGWDFSGCSNMGELQLLLEEKLMIRRLKKEVLSQLPSKLRKMVLLDPSSIKISKEMKRTSTTENFEKLKGMKGRKMLLEYFHDTAQAKVDAVRGYVLDLLESGQKFLLFGHHQELLDALETALDNKESGCFIRIDGRTPSEQRKSQCDRFQTNDSVRVALLSITAANAGLNLTSASLVVFAELFWNPGILVQAEDRVHRIGQKDSVNVHYLVAPGTADDHIWPLVQNKLSVLSKVGLSKEDFSEADTCHQQNSKQEDLRKFFEESFFEDSSATDEQGEITGDVVCSSPKKESSPADKYPKKSPTKQSKIGQFFKRQTGVAIGNQSDIKFDQPDASDEIEDDCDWLDDIVEWEESNGQPQAKKLKL